MFSLIRNWFSKSNCYLELEVGGGCNGKKTPSTGSLYEKWLKKHIRSLELSSGGSDIVTIGFELRLNGRCGFMTLVSLRLSASQKAFCCSLFEETIKSCTASNNLAAFLPDKLLLLLVHYLEGCGHTEAPFFVVEVSLCSKMFNLSDYSHCFKVFPPRLLFLFLISYFLVQWSLEEKKKGRSRLLSLKLNRLTVIFHHLHC